MVRNDKNQADAVSLSWRVRRLNSFTSLQK
jgi:hypothetical protein